MSDPVLIALISVTGSVLIAALGFWQARKPVPRRAPRTHAAEIARLKKRIVELEAELKEQKQP